MEWIVEAETLKDLLDGRFTVLTKPLIRCKDCKWYGYYSCEMGGNDWMRDGNGFCDRSERKDGKHEKAD